MLTMPVDQELLEQAQRLSRPAVEALLECVYPAVHRMAHGLSGRADVARGIIRFVVGHSVRQIPLWKDADAPYRWFYHHTVLTARRASRHQPTAQDDILLGESPDADYLAFVRAIRVLPIQQREAFILHHGENMGLRYLAIAMDCSTRAAELHLEAAEQALRAIAGRQFNEMSTRLAEVYAALAPTEDVVRPEVKLIVARSLWPRWLVRAVKWLIVLAVISALAWAAWQVRWALDGGPATRP